MFTLNGVKFVVSYFWENGHPVACNFSALDSAGAVLFTGVSAKEPKRSLHKRVARHKALCNLLEKMQYTRKQRLEVWGLYYLKTK